MKIPTIHQITDHAHTANPIIGTARNNVEMIPRVICFDEFSKYRLIKIIDNASGTAVQYQSVPRKITPAQTGRIN